MFQGFFVPFHCYRPNPICQEDKLVNVSLANEFLTSLGLHPRHRAIEVVRGDIKAGLRILYGLFIKFKPNES